MKCQDFETIMISLARGQLIEASARETALAHLERCLRCATAFDEQRALTAGMRAVVESLADQGASACVEEALRRAFREQARQPTVPEINLLPKMSWRWPRQLRWMVGAAAAAILLLALLIGAVWLKSPANQKQETTNLPATPSIAAPTQRQELPPRMEAAKDQSQKLARNSAGSRRLSRHRGIRQDAAPEAEAATSFYLLVEEGELVPLESGQVVRVEMPASALIALGLPVTAESRDRPVQADLLLGQDGLARAIRFLP